MTDLPLDRVYQWEAARPQEVFLTQPVIGIARDWTWAQTMDEARRVANHLMEKNWPAGSHVVIYSKNCAWWIMAELAIWMSGHITVPIYPSLTLHSARELFEHCDPVACFLGPLDSTQLIGQAVPANLYAIRFPNATATEGLSWEEIIRTTEPLATNPLRRADEIATIIYTSGTTGSFKGAMHRFITFPYLAQAIAQVVGESRQRQLSYLPLAHIAERGLSETSAIYYSWNLFFNESTATFLADLKRAQATVFFSVPRLYAKFQQKVFENVPRGTLDLLLRVPMIKTLAGKYIMHSMGFGHVAFAASGSAALPGELLRWFRALGLPLTEGYGTTETGITHTAPHGECRPGWTGKNAPGVEAKLSAVGEVLLRSPMNMVGYYKNEEDSRQAFTVDGFVRTGDLGEITPDGWLKITGRIKEQFKTAKGKYVAPSKIEALISAHPAVENCLVLGTNLAAPCAVVVLTRATAQLASSEVARKELEQSFETLLDEVNGQVEVHEHLALIALVNDRWTIDSGFVTPTLKLKRTPLEAHYAQLIAGWLQQGTRIIWHLAHPNEK
jgi:long-chain acyl-CoA synthetase